MKNGNIFHIIDQYPNLMNLSRASQFLQKPDLIERRLKS